MTKSILLVAVLTTPAFAQNPIDGFFIPERGNKLLSSEVTQIRMVQTEKFNPTNAGESDAFDLAMRKKQHKITTISANLTLGITDNFSVSTNVHYTQMNLGNGGYKAEGLDNPTVTTRYAMEKNGIYIGGELSATVNAGSESVKDNVNIYDARLEFGYRVISERLSLIAEIVDTVSNEECHLREWAWEVGTQIFFTSGQTLTVSYAERYKKYQARNNTYTPWIIRYNVWYAKTNLFAGLGYTKSDFRIDHNTDSDYDFEGDQYSVHIGYKF